MYKLRILLRSAVGLSGGEPVGSVTSVELCVGRYPSVELWISLGSGDCLDWLQEDYIDTASAYFVSFYT